MTYDELLANAPRHDSPEFLEYLRENNNVRYEDDWWLVIENYKYFKHDRWWFTAFAKRTLSLTRWDGLYRMFGNFTWLKKSPKKQTVQRFHIHMYEE